MRFRARAAIVVITLVLPLRSSAEESLRMRVRVEASALEHAAERFRLVHGRWPRDVDELVSRQEISRQARREHSSLRFEPDRDFACVVTAGSRRSGCSTQTYEYETCFPPP